MDDANKSKWWTCTLLFLTSQCITLFGSTLVQMALVWYATMQTASGIWVAAFSVCAYLPKFFMSFVGGVWADRYPRKWLIIAGDVTIAGMTLMMVLIMPVLSDDFVLLIGLLMLSFVRALGAGVQMPAVNALLPQLVPKEALLRVNGINASMQAVVNFAAPAAAGAVMAIGSLRAILMIDVVTAVIGVGMLSLLRLPAKAKASQSAKQNLWRSLTAGLRTAFAQADTRLLLLLYGFFTFFCVPAGFLAGLYVRRIFGASYWLLTAVELVGFAGMFAGGLLMSAWGGFRTHARTLMASLAILGVCAALLGLVVNFIPYLAVMLFYGVAMTMVQTAITTMLQEAAPPVMQGRVFGLQNSMYAGALPLGMAVFGPLADVLPLASLMVFSGLAFCGLSVSVYCFAARKED